MAVEAEDVVAVLRERMEEMIPPHRRAPDWDRKWQELEEFAHATDQD